MTKAIRKAAQATMAIRIRPELVMEALAKGSKPCAPHLGFKESGRKAPTPLLFASLPGWYRNEHTHRQINWDLCETRL